ncbi:unnamed protein product [Oreochromis niloticus]|nr:unnamed protein product [Mustela putorius furo]
MSVKILSITLLLLSICVCCHSEGTHEHPGRIPPCCPAVTKGNMTADVVGQTYHKLAARYHCVKAIIFDTKDGQLCADPDAQWVKDLTAKMRKV